MYITGRRKEVLEQAAKEHDPTSGGGGKQHEAGQIIPMGPCDVTKKADLEKLCKEIESKESHLSLVVAAAGVSGPKGPQTPATRKS